MLDKIKELVATCDSKNIELAIALGVNMEGYDKGELISLMSTSFADNFKLSFSQDESVLDLPRVYGVMCEIEFEDDTRLKGTINIHKFISSCIDAYLNIEPC